MTSVREWVDRYELNGAVALILAWAAASDDKLVADEVTFIQAFLSKVDRDISATSVHEILQNAKPSEKAFVLEYASDHVIHEQRHSLIELVLRLSLSDGDFDCNEIAFTRLVADSLLISQQMLDRLFWYLTGRPFPEDCHPDEIWWWERHDTSGKWHNNNASTHASLWAYQVLGIELGAPADSVRATYRRLAKETHPDRFTSIGPAAVEAANQAFKRLVAAYEEVMRNA